MFIVFGMADSGNCYKVRLVLEQLNLPYRWVEVNPGRGDTRSLAAYPAFGRWLERVKSQPRHQPMQ